jgi:histone methylation protein DOT1
LSGFAALQTLVKALDADGYLMDSDRFRVRAEALDLLDAFNLDAEATGSDAGPEHVALCQRARELRAEFEEANFRLYESIRDSIRRSAGCNALLRYAGEAVDETTEQPNATEDPDSFDSLDELVSGVFRFAVSDEPKIDLSSEMVAYQPTPSRHIFELIGHANLTAEDVFIDLGSGLGHVPLLIAICTKARAIGIELEPSYVECATQCARDLKLVNAAFLEMDARDADLSSGTVFYLYTPFRGAILRSVLDRLRTEAKTRTIRVCSFGPCTPIVSAESWLAFNAAESGHIAVLYSHVNGSNEALSQ